MYKQKLFTIFIMMVMLLSLLGPSFGVSARPLDTGTSPALGALLNYSVLGGAAVTNANGTTTDGNVGVSPQASITGFPPGFAGGTSTTNATFLHSNDSSAIAAQAAALSTYNNLTTQGCDHNYADGQDLTLLSPLVPGVYCSAGSFLLTGHLALTGNTGVWIFKTVSTLITSPGSSVTGGDPCNVWWRIGSSTTLDTTTSFIGTVISHEGVNAMNSGATLNGRFLALSVGTVTLNDNTITGPICKTTTTTHLSASTITAGHSASDSASLGGTGIVTSGLGGTVTYNVYSDPACTSLYTVSSGHTVNSGVVTGSGPIPFPTTGTYYWQAVYNGDTYNSNSFCGDEVLTVASAPTSAPAAASTPTGGVLPGTGFAPQRVTALPAQSTEKAYSNLGDLWLEIPRLGVQMPIVGVPQTNGEWEVSWLGNDAGWLNGTAFPTYSGNSVLAGHVYNADGTPGPFVHLNGLWWGDQVIVHAWGAQYVYEVRSVLQVSPYATSSVITHKDLPWVTLITCRGYDEASNSYKYRIAVGAVLVEVK